MIEDFRNCVAEFDTCRFSCCAYLFFSFEKPRELSLLISHVFDDLIFKTNSYKLCIYLDIL